MTQLHIHYLPLIKCSAVGKHLLATANIRSGPGRVFWVLIKKMGYQRPVLYYTDENSCKNIICKTENSFFIPTHSQELLIQTNRDHSQA